LGHESNAIRKTFIHLSEFGVSFAERLFHLYLFEKKQIAGLYVWCLLLWAGVEWSGVGARLDLGQVLSKINNKENYTVGPCGMP
jgi:hypothetical protein